MGEAARVSGRCLCGAVRFAAVPEKLEMDVCHCGMCRRWSGGVLMSVPCNGLEVEDEKALGRYASSEWAERGFCRQCGTPLFYRLVGKEFYAVSTEAFDDRSGFAFTSQIFIDEKPAYYEFANKTKTMTGAEVFAAFAQENQSAAQE